MILIRNPADISLGWRGEEGVKRLGCSSYLLGFKKAAVVLLRVFSLKRSTAGAFAVPFRVLNRKKYDRRNVLFYN